LSEELEDIVIIEDSDAAALGNNEESDSSNQEQNEAKKKKKQLFIIIGAAILVAIILIVVLVLLLKKETPQPQKEPFANIEKKIDTNKKPKIKPSELESMIAKANYLYQNGSKEEALYLYEKIAIYSEAISQYNLGVAQLKNKQYKLALSTFKKAIKNDEKRCVSAINAAVCALHINDKKSFQYYIDLAYAYLPQEVNSPLYSYYFALISYYKQNYLATLSALKHKTSNEYPKTQKHLQAKIDALFENNYDAIDALDNHFIDTDHFNIALLYARVGDYTLAINHFEEALLKGEHPLKSKLAMGFVKLKAGRVKDGAKDIQEVTKKYKADVYKPYPLEVYLKHSLFDPQKAYDVYKKEIRSSKFIQYSEIFYFAPYKIFNATKTLQTIEKASANIYIDDVKTAQEYLKNSISSSSVNIGIAKAIKKALEFKLYDANQELQKLLKIQPKHPILLYNLALTYAKLGDIQNAYKYFIRSYHLDSKNYISGIFALMSAKLIDHKNRVKLYSLLSDALSEEEETTENKLYRTLLYFVHNDFLSIDGWLDEKHKPRPFNLVLTNLIAQELHKEKSMQESAKQLVEQLPNDILPHIIYANSFFLGLDAPNYSKEVQKHFKQQHFHFKDLYYGAYITSFLYIKNNVITGQLYYLQQQLKHELSVTTKNKRELLSALALTSLFNQSFEESYVYYNELIDNQKVRDAQTLFLGAVASIAAGHHENAIALLELSKLKDKNFLETRYALGLLYLEARNNKGATIQLSQVNKNGFISRYFDFKIDTNKLLFYKQKTEKEKGKKEQ